MAKSKEEQTKDQTGNRKRVKRFFIFSHLCLRGEETLE
jgi:hypothetical protein